MNLLVTGGAGFIGRHFIGRALCEAEVACLVNLDCLTYAGRLENVAEAAQDPRYRFEKVDLRDAPAVAAVVERHDISHVVHLAAESHVDRSISGPADFIHTNVLGTHHLLEACRAAGGRIVRYVQVSTDEVYGSLGAEGLFTETTPYAPNSPYSASKAAADHLARAWHHTYGLPVTVTNCSNNYGPWQYPEKLIPVVIQSALERRPIPVYGDGQNVRDWLHVEDHAEALWQVLKRGRAGEVYNIGCNNEVTNLDLVRRLCALVDAQHPHPAGSARDLITFVQDRPGHDRRYALNAEKIRQELGWQPRHTFEAGLRETVAWYVDNQAWVRSAGER